MSQRGKRQASRVDDGPVATKRRKGRSLAVAEEEEATLEGWTARTNTDIKLSTIYNRNATEAPAELFRKDLISAMKLPDSEPLNADEYWVINDQWKQEWEKGVQVPVNPDSLPSPSVSIVSPTLRPCSDFKLPKSKYIRITKDDNFKPDDHYLSPIPSKAEKVCSYDLDNCDVAWLRIVNGERANMGYPPMREDQFERVIEELEIRCWEKVQTIVKSEEGLGIEYDENVICDVCRSPESEEGNEMVFCDSCNICVHQACYGITTIPSGSWLCRTCALGKRPECVLCPNKGGAMKCTRSGHKWAHVSCALWIPEVSIGCVEKMEPITKISSIPQSRWALICVLCRERVGACIQCSIKTCKIAYHVTCAFKHGLEMKAIIEDENADDGVKLRSYCEKHSVTPKKDRCGSASDDDDCKRKKRNDMTSEEKNQARAAKLQEIESEFDKHVNSSDVTGPHDVDSEGILAIYNYWVLKRRAGHNKPLIAPRSDDVDFLSRQQEQADLEKMRMFVQLRQDLERVRNLCYMVSRREKLSRTFFKMREQTFHAQIDVLSSSNYTLSSAEITAIKESNHGPSIYDRLYSHPSAPDLSTDFETVLARIAGVSSPTPEDKSKIDRNGMRKKTENPYKKMYNGGLERRRNVYASMSSGSDTDIKRSLRMGLDTSSADEKPRKPLSKEVPPIKGKKLSKKRSAAPRVNIDTSTEDDELKPSKNMWESPRSKSLQQMEKELSERTATDDSDDLITFTPAKKEARNVSNIYSDSDTDSSVRDSRSETSHTMRTKAAMKEFSASNQARKKLQKKSLTKGRSEMRAEREHLDSSFDDEYYKDKENVNTSKRKNKDSPTTDLIVPQRQAAKKAAESLKGSSKKPDQVLSEQETVKTVSPSDENKIKPKASKLKGKEIKENKLSKEDRVKHSSGDIYDFDKDSCLDNQDILAYVPQRQAAKKAAEHIKSGLHKPGAENEMEPGKLKVPEGAPSTALTTSSTPTPPKPSKKDQVDTVKSKKETDVLDKSKKLNKAPEPKGRKSPRSSISSTSSSTSSSSSSGSTSTSSSSSSESGEEDEAKSPEISQDKKSLFDPPVLPKEAEKKLTEKTKALPEKKATGKKFEMSSFLEKGKHSVHSSSTSSSSESDEDSDKETPKKPLVVNKPKVPETKPVDIHKEDSNLKGSVAKKLRKTPDKKLKTSDGRPELEFQQPPTEREESSRAQEKSGRKSKGEGVDTSIGQLQAKHKHDSNKIQSPEPVRSTRSRSHTPRREDIKPETQSKKEALQQQGRKRKSDVGPGNASLQEAKRGPSPIKQAEAPLVEEKNRREHPTTPSKKTDQKVESPKDPDFLASTLEREIAERKAGRDSMTRNNSKKSLDRLFEKRDKLVKENERKNDEKNALLNDSLFKKKVEEVTKLLSPNKEKHDFPVVNDIIESGITKDWNKYNSESTNISKSKSFNKSPKKPIPRSLFSPEYEHPDDQDKMAPQTHSLLDEPPKILIEPHVPLPREPKETSVAVSIPHEMPPSLPKQPDHGSLPVLSPVTLHDNHKQDVILSVPQLEKITNSDVPSEFPEHNAPKKVGSRNSSLSALCYPQRSLFSPQPPTKDSVAELFDFDHDILAVDESVHDGMVRDSDELRGSHPLSFSFNNELLFSKVDSREDSARETLNLVEKLRMEYAKKTQSDTVESSDEIISVPPEPSEELPEQPEEPLKCIEESKADIPVSRPEAMELIAPSIPEEIKQNTHLDLEDHKVLDSVEACELNIMKPAIMDEAALRLGGDHPLLPIVGPEKHEQSQFEASAEHFLYPPYGITMDVGKVPGREKLDRSSSAQADERWVPPSSVPPPSVHSYEHIPHSPYRNKWADSEIMPSRHSSSSSASSTSSSSHRDEEQQVKHDELVLPGPTPNNIIPELVPFQGLHSGMPYNPSCALANASAYHYPDPTYPPVPPVQLFQTPSCPQMTFSSGASALFQSNFPSQFTTPHTLVNKPPDEPIHMPPPCTAAFTASSHNMALTAAMVSPITANIQDQEPPLTPLPFPPDTTTTTAPCIPQVVTPTIPPPPPAPSLESALTEPVVEAFNHQAEPPPTPTIQEELPPTPKSVGKKSPAKPTRTSARFTAQQSKSPAKSPAISPRQQEPSGRGRGREGAGKRGRPPGSGRGGNRGRGRGRGRGRANTHIHSDPNTIHSKLVGTVYDFDFDDDEDGESLENLRAMRERRKSSDVHDRKSDGSFSHKDSSESPKFTSPTHSNKSKSSYTADIRDLRPPSPAIESRSERPIEAPIVQPLLPGPVDMRTYSSYETSTINTTYHNHLLEPFTATPASEVKDLVEEIDEELQALKPSKVPKVDTTSEIVTVVNESTNKLSVGDSRNQLKVKIKGPFLDANYTPSTVVSQIQPPVPNITQSDATSGVSSISNSTNSSGTSNLRRMRKKELLRQYWTQDMNMDEAASSIPPPAPTPDPMVNRTVITIPKAVASMTSIPTREDYRAVVDANMEKKRKKEKNYVGFEPLEESERRRSVGNSGGANETGHPLKRRGRTPKVNPPPVNTAPKLKIKLGGDGNQASVSTLTDDRKNLRVRPPKKRINTAATMPTVEELKRESMKFRKMMMADFEEEDKRPEHEEKERKRKKKRHTDEPSVQVITNESNPKLIIRFGKRTEGAGEFTPTPPPSTSPPPDPSSPPTERTSEFPTLRNVRTSKTTPIRLKISRCEEGYVMKDPCSENPKTNSEISVTASEVKNSKPPHPPPPTLPLSKDCEVR